MKKRISFICKHCNAELEVDEIFNHYIDDSNNMHIIECVSTCPYCHVVYSYEKAYKFVSNMNIEEHKV